MLTNQPKQQPPPSSDPSNSGPDLDTSSPPQPQEPSTPDTGQSEPLTDTPLATIQEPPRDHQPEVRTHTRLIKPPTRFKDFELKSCLPLTFALHNSTVAESSMITVRTESYIRLTLPTLFCFIYYYYFSFFKEGGMLACHLYLGLP